MSATVSSTFSRRFRRVAAGLAASLALGALSAHAAPTPFPTDFRSSQVVNADATINVRVGGHGPAVVLIHGFGDTGDMWSPMAAVLAKDQDRKSTRLNSSHSQISYAVFCLKKKKQ